MADITITPAGAAFNPTDTVTSTRLNEARNPTAALDAGTIVNADVSATADISGSKLANTSVTFTKLDDVIDDDTMGTATNTTLATSESIKAYVDEGGGFTPSTYAGGESVTLPNGFIMKFGRTVAGQTGNQAVVFGSPFDNEVISIVVTLIDSGSDAGSGNPFVQTGYDTTGFTMFLNTAVNGGSFWQAIGY